MSILLKLLFFFMVIYGVKTVLKSLMVMKQLNERAEESLKKDKFKQKDIIDAEFEVKD
jgi:uncharacterized membrane protein